MINALTKLHRTVITTGNAIAHLMVKVSNHKMRRSTQKISNAEKFKSEVILTVALTIEQEKSKQRDFLKHIKSAERLMINV